MRLGEVGVGPQDLLFGSRRDDDAYDGLVEPVVAGKDGRFPAGWILLPQQPNTTGRSLGGGQHQHSAVRKEPDNKQRI